MNPQRRNKVAQSSDNLRQRTVVAVVDGGAMVRWSVVEFAQRGTIASSLG